MTTKFRKKGLKAVNKVPKSDFLKREIRKKVSKMKRSELPASLKAYKKYAQKG